jgi:hypothetical protein
MTFREYLRSIYACSDALDWLGDRSSREAWEACERPDWMLELCGRLSVDPRLIVLCATGCARSVLHLVPAGEDRPRLAIEAAEAWAYGRGSSDAGNGAPQAAAESAESAAWAAVRGAPWAADIAVMGAAAWAATAATAARTAESAARGAARAADWAATALAAEATEAAGEATLAAHRRYAQDIRGIIPWEHVADRLRAVGVEVGA